MNSEAPDDWRRFAMGDVVEPTYRPVEVRPEEEYPLLGVRWYCDGPRHHGTHSGKSLKTSTLHQVRSGEITYNKMWVKKAAFAVLGQEQDGLYATSEYPTFAPDRKQLDLAFFGKLVQTKEFQELAAASCKGTTSRARLNPKDFLRLPVVLPPLPEQRKIAEILGSVDEAIKATEAVIEHTRRVKEGLLQELLTKGIGHSKFKQTDIGEIPEGWEVVPFEDVCTISHGYAFKSDLFTDEPTPFHLLSPGNFSRFGGYQAHKNRFYLGQPESSYVLNEGDLLVTMTDLTPGCETLGLPLRVPRFSGYRALHNQRLGKVGILRSVVSRDFLYLVMLSRRYREIIRTTATGSTVRHTSPSRILSVLIPLPSADEQRYIVECLDSLDSLLLGESAKKEQLELMKAGLLQDLLTGKVRVKL